MTLQIPFYGPEVYCPFSDQPEATRSPYASGPWHCFACGATGHEPTGR